jgi:hypothetical protein
VTTEALRFIASFQSLDCFQSSVVICKPVIDLLEIRPLMKLYALRGIAI